MESIQTTYLPLDTVQLGGKKTPGKALNLEQAREAAQDFEAFFLSKMTESMFEGISTDGLFGGGNSEKIYRSMLINEYGKVMARTGSVGVAGYVMDSILKMQESFGTNEAQKTQEV